MDKEETYHINSYVVGMDSGFGDRKCLTISEIKDGKIYVKGTLYDECAEIVGTIFQELQQKENIIKEVRKYCLDKAKGRLERTLYDDILEILDKENI